MLEIEVIFSPFILCWVVEKSAREIGKIKNWQKLPSAPNWSTHVSMFGNGFLGLSTFCWQVVSLENDRHFSPYYPTSHDPGLEECKLSVMSKSWGQIKLREITGAAIGWELTPLQIHITELASWWCILSHHMKREMKERTCMKVG